jgi:ParB family chromosome partitioning protein
MGAEQKKKGGLGRGLGALLENAPDLTQRKNDSEEKGAIGSVSMISIKDIEANPFNPRTHFEKEALEELSKSIEVHGIIQPLTLRSTGRDKYQLISGERRFRASQLAGLTEVPAYIRVANDQSMLEMALVENIQREDLNAIEVALSYQRLIEECALTQEQMSQKIAKSRSSITNHLRLLKLPVEIQKSVRDGNISMGHARALVSAGDEELQLILHERILNEQLSVRELELMIRDGINTPTKKIGKTTLSPISINENQRNFCTAFSNKTSTRVDIKKSNNGSGKITIQFNSEVDLNRIIEILNK